MNEQKTYRIGMIGAGMIARQHLEHLRNSGRTEVTWIAALNPGNLESVRSEFNIRQRTHDYHDMLRDPEVDAILITTPPHLHKAMFTDAVRAGKHVLVEKPLALHRKDMEEMLAVKAQFPATIAMDCSGRHARLNPKFLKVKEIVDSGILGEIYRIHHTSIARQGRPGIEFHPAAKWFLDRDRAGGGPLFDWGVYDLSFHLGLLGDRHDLEKIDRVVLKGGLDETDPGTEIYNVEEHFVIHMMLTGNISYDWERGAHANVEVPNESRIFGTRGGIKLAYCTWDHPKITLYDLDARGRAREQQLEVDMKQHPNDGYALVDHFIRVMDGIEQPVITLEQAKKHMDIIIRCAQFADNSLL